jgi:hypothetical protein
MFLLRTEPNEKIQNIHYYLAIKIYDTYHNIDEFQSNHVEESHLKSTYCKIPFI